MNELAYTTETPINYRKDYGQFFTPSLVANIMAKWVTKDNAKAILDPAFGLGIFFDEVMKLNIDPDVLFTGYEIDERILTYLNYEGTKSNLLIFKEDYLEADTGKFDGVICNPPYMRFQKFLKRYDVLPKIEKKIGEKLAGYSNVSSVFLVKAINELNDNGRLAFIMPFEFFNTGYGKEIKKSLLKEHLLKQIVIFSNEKDIFPDVTTTVCILLCKNDGKEEPIKITAVKSEDEIRNIKDVSNYFQYELNQSDLPYDKKWTPIISTLYVEQQIPEDFCKISQYGAFKRGIATGANEFFALTKSKIEEFGLVEKNICKCITKSPQLKKYVFTEDDFYSLYNDDKPVHCLDVKECEDFNVRKYIEIGEQQELHKRYLTKNRKPWYKIEHRRPSPILFGVFNRGRLKVIRNYSKAINFTCFHSFYPNMFGEGIVNKLFVYFLSDLGQSIIKLNKRNYGNNLDKLEPGDLNDCLCPNQEQFDLIGNDEAERVIEIAKTNTESAIHISNELVDRILTAQQGTLPFGNSI